MPPLLLLTRPEPASRRFAAAVAETGVAHRLLVAPLSRVVPVDFDAAALGQARGVILTSAQAVRAAAGLGLPAWCVGPGTTRAAQAAGITAHQAGYDAASLVAGIVAAGVSGPLIHLHGAHLALDVADALRAQGIEARGLQVYATEDLGWSDAVAETLAASAGIVAPVFSPRGAMALDSALLSALGDRLARDERVAISAAACPGGGCRIAETPDHGGMLRATVAALRESAPGA